MVNLKCQQPNGLKRATDSIIFGHLPTMDLYHPFFVVSVTITCYMLTLLANVILTGVSQLHRPNELGFGKIN